jgi:hypothetical protein
MSSPVLTIVPRTSPERANFAGRLRAIAELEEFSNLCVDLQDRFLHPNGDNEYEREEDRERIQAVFKGIDKASGALFDAARIAKRMAP